MTNRIGNPGKLLLLAALIFTSLWTAAAMGALVAASFRAMGVAIVPEAVGLAFSGTLVVYNLDRLRDLDRDQCGSPDRSAFVLAHEGWLLGLAAVAAAASFFFVARAGAWTGVAASSRAIVGPGRSCRWGTAAIRRQEVGRAHL